MFRFNVVLGASKNKTYRCVSFCQRKTSRSTRDGSRTDNLQTPQWATYFFFRSVNDNLLGHLFSIRGEYQSIHNEIFPCWFIKQSCGKYHEGVEPTSCLIESLGDKVSWKTRLKSFLVLKGIMRLCVGHATRFEPTIKDL